MTIRLANTTRNAMANALAGEVDGGPAAGTLEIRSGAQPATAETAASGTLLATVTLVDPSFGAAANGVITLADPPSVNGVAAGTAGWFRVKKSSGETVFDGSVGTAGADLNLATTTVSVGLAIDITGGTITVPAG